MIWPPESAWCRVLSAIDIDFLPFRVVASFDCLFSSSVVVEAVAGNLFSKVVFTLFAVHFVGIDCSISEIELLVEVAVAAPCLYPYTVTNVFAVAIAVKRQEAVANAEYRTARILFADYIPVFRECRRRQCIVTVKPHNPFVCSEVQTKDSSSALIDVVAVSLQIVDYSD